METLDVSLTTGYNRLLITHVTRQQINNKISNQSALATTTTTTIYDFEFKPKTIDDVTLVNDVSSCVFEEVALAPVDAHLLDVRLVNNADVTCDLNEVVVGTSSDCVFIWFVSSVATVE